MEILVFSLTQLASVTYQKPIGKFQLPQSLLLLNKNSGVQTRLHQK